MELNASRRSENWWLRWRARSRSMVGGEIFHVFKCTGKMQMQRSKMCRLQASAWDAYVTNSIIWVFFVFTKRLVTWSQASQAQAENEEFMPYGKLSMRGCSGAIMEHLWLPGASVGRLACCPSSQNLFFPLWILFINYLISFRVEKWALGDSGEGSTPLWMALDAIS